MGVGVIRQYFRNPGESGLILSILETVLENIVCLCLVYYFISCTPFKMGSQEIFVE